MVLCPASAIYPSAPEKRIVEGLDLLVVAAAVAVGKDWFQTLGFQIWGGFDALLREMPLIRYLLSTLPT